MFNEFSKDERNIIKRCLEILLEDEWVSFGDMPSILCVTAQQLHAIVEAFPQFDGNKHDEHAVLARLGLSHGVIECAIGGSLTNVYSLTRLPQWILRGHYGVNPDDVISVRNKWRDIHNQPKHLWTRQVCQRSVGCWEKTGRPAGVDVFAQFANDELRTILRCLEIIGEGEWVLPDEMPVCIGTTEPLLRRIIKTFPLLFGEKIDQEHVLSSIGLSEDALECVVTNCLSRIRKIAQKPRWVLEDHYGLRPEDVIHVEQKWRLLHNLPVVKRKGMGDIE